MDNAHERRKHTTITTESERVQKVSSAAKLIGVPSCRAGTMATSLASTADLLTDLTLELALLRIPRQGAIITRRGKLARVEGE